MDEAMLALGRVAYERWVEGMEGVIQMPGQVVMGLPPWTNKEVPEFELPDDQKELWARVAIAARADAYLNGAEHGAREARKVKVTDEMVLKAWQALPDEFDIPDIKQALRVALQTAGLEVIE